MSGSTGPSPGPNPNVPAITQPIATPEANTRVLLQVRQAIQSLGGQIGNPTDRAVTFNDLNNMGLTGQPPAGSLNRLTALEQRMTALEARVTKLEEEFAALPPPP